VVAAEIEVVAAEKLLFFSVKREREVGAFIGLICTHGCWVEDINRGVGVSCLLRGEVNRRGRTVGSSILEAS